MNSVKKALILFVAGGGAYYLIELMFRGYSHGSMFLVGGLCFLLVGLLNEQLSFDMPLKWQMLLGSLLITVVELISGLIVNSWLGLNVWDYSSLPFNLWGQISLLFTILWIPLSGGAILLDDYLRYRWFGEERPHYRF
ncbi:hypothetical protein Ami103574_07790 [Aminipila butyrica]|uniref:ABC-transporter type IV n=1 Tax=Aminipila butyrica TaxID=433296 RepID=A0A858BTA5_9FIRM|nr:hypothetical protein [Aminipila butyrica]QIB69231.1 hypothetical protein Ami103574_07790 [Aminipila butyrica]